MSVRKQGGRSLRLLATFGVAATAVSAGVWLSRGALEEKTSTASAQMDKAAAQAIVQRNLPKMPLAFEANRGQTDKSVNFVARGVSATMWLTDSEAVFGFSSDGKGADDVLRMQFVGAAKPRVQGVAPQAAKSHYLRADAEIRDVPRFGEVAYADLYPGVNLRWYGDRSTLEYDVVVAPGADPSVVRMKMQGADEVKVRADGALCVKIGEREIVQHAPVAYQTKDGVRESVASSFRVDGNDVTFQVGSYDRTRELVLDPSIDWSTYFGGSGDETCNRVAVDWASTTPGIVICGGTNSIDLPLGFGHIPNAPKGNYDAYVTKLDPSGQFVLFSTYLGGTDYDEAWGVAVDFTPPVSPTSGNIWLTGQTWSSNFPTFKPRQATKNGPNSWDAFVVGLDKTGDHLLYSSYLGGSKNDFGRGIALDASSFVYVTGFTNSDSNFPIANATQPVYGGGANDAFVVALDPRNGVNPPLSANPSVAYYTSSYLGGIGDDRAYDVAVNNGGGPLLNNVYVCGSTGSVDFPHLNVFNGINHTVQDTYGGGLMDAFATRFNSGATQRLWSTTWGGSGDDEAHGVAVDYFTGDVAICGRTNSFDYPRVSAVQATRKGPDDAFVAKFRTLGDVVDFSTYLGGRGSDVANAVVINPFAGVPDPTTPFPGDVYVVGTSDSLDLPVTTDAFQSQLQNAVSNPMNTDAFVARFGTFHNDFGIAQSGVLKFGSYFGGNDYEYGNGIALAFSPFAYNSKVVIAGTTRSTVAFPFGPLPAYQTSKNGASDAFVARLAESNPGLFPAGDLTTESRTPDSVAIAWKNPVPNATDLVVDRIGTDGQTTTVATIAPTVTQFVDTGLAADTTYNYTITAKIEDGTKVQSDVIAASTLPYPPSAAHDLAVAVDGSKVSLSWSAASGQTSYEIQRSVDGGEFSVFATAKSGATSFETTQVLAAEQDATWRVVAVNRGGSSAPSNEVSSSAKPTLSVSVTSGTLVDAKLAGADKFTASGKIAGVEGFDPNTQAMRIEIGSASQPVVLTVPAADRGWSTKRGVLTFNSAKSFVGGARFTLALDAKKGTFSLAVSGFDFPAAVVNPVSVGFALGADAGATQASWVAKGAGKYSVK